MIHSPLGRGLSSLLGEEKEGYRMISIELILPRSDQPRTYFSESALQELALSIKEKGILSPIIVRPFKEKLDKNYYEIIVGERRWRAAKKLGFLEIPVIVRDLEDKEVAEISLIENINREDLSALEEAESYQYLIDLYGHTQESLANVLGKSRSYISNTLRLIQLPDVIKKKLQDKKISAGHARTLIGMSESEALKIVDFVTEKSMSVRDLEDLIRQKKRTLKNKKNKNNDIVQLENMLSEILGLEVHIRQKNENIGQLTIFYSSLEKLDQICQFISHGVIAQNLNKKKKLS